MDLLTIAEVAERTRLPVNTLRAYRARGLGPTCARVGGRRLMYRSADVDAWIKAQFAKAAAIATEVA